MFLNFFVTNILILLQVRMFVLNKPFQPSLIFAGNARAYPREELVKCFALGKALVLAHKH
jgi:hypothetical protein